MSVQNRKHWTAQCNGRQWIMGQHTSAEETTFTLAMHWLFCAIANTANSLQVNHTHCNTNREHFLSANSQKLTNKQTTSKTITSTCWFMVHFTSTKRRKQRILFSNNRVDFPSAVSVLCFCLITWRVASATTPLTYRPLNRFKTEQQQEKHSTFHCQWMRESNKLSSAGEEEQNRRGNKVPSATTPQQLSIRHRLN